MISLDKIRAVTFDVGGTLIEPWPSVGHVYSAVACEALGMEADPQLLNRQFVDAWKTRGAFDYSRGAWLDLVCRTFSGVCAEPHNFFDKLYDRFGAPGAWRIYADVEPTLSGLRAKNVRLGVISNWDERLRPLLSRLNLEKWFAVVVVSQEARVTKPSAGIFDRALEELGLAATEVLHVGDSLSEDLLGARHAGLHSLLLNRESPVADDASTISTLTALLGDATPGTGQPKRRAP
jgi:putative hydrolase of the HAD superfamily